MRRAFLARRRDSNTPWPFRRNGQPVGSPPPRRGRLKPVRTPAALDWKGVLGYTESEKVLLRAWSAGVGEFTFRDARVA